MSTQNPPKYRGGGQKNFWVENKIPSWIPDNAIQYIRENSENLYTSGDEIRPRGSEVYRIDKNGQIEYARPGQPGNWGIQPDAETVESAFSKDSKLSDNEKMVILRGYLGIAGIKYKDDIPGNEPKFEFGFGTDSDKPSDFFESIVNNAWARLIQSEAEKVDRDLAAKQAAGKLTTTVARRTNGDVDANGNYIPRSVASPPFDTSRLITLDTTHPDKNKYPAGKPIFEENIIADICINLGVPSDRWNDVGVEMVLNSEPTSVLGGVGDVRVDGNGNIIGARPFGLTGSKNSYELYTAKKYGSKTMIVSIGFTSFVGSVSNYANTMFGPNIFSKIGDKFAHKAIHLLDDGIDIGGLGKISGEKFLTGLKVLNAIINYEQWTQPLQEGDIEGFALKNPGTPVLMYFAGHAVSHYLAHLGIFGATIGLSGGLGLLVAAAYILWETNYDARKEEKPKTPANYDDAYKQNLRAAADDIDKSLPGNQSVMYESLEETGGKWAVVIQPETTVTQLSNQSGRIIRTVTISSVEHDGAYKIPIGVQQNEKGELIDIYPPNNNYRVKIETKYPDGRIIESDATPGRQPIITNVPPRPEIQKEIWRRVNPNPRDPQIPRFAPRPRQDNLKPRYHSAQLPLIPYGGNQNSSFINMDLQVTDKYTLDKQNEWVLKLNATNQNNKENGYNSNLCGPEVASGPTQLPDDAFKEATSELDKIKQKDMQQWTSAVTDWNSWVLAGVNEDNRIPLNDNHIGINNTDGTSPSGKITLGRFIDRIIDGQRVRIYYDPETGEELYKFKFKTKSILTEPERIYAGL